MLAQEKEQRRRLRPGTLVVGTCPFVAQEKTVRGERGWKIPLK